MDLFDAMGEPPPSEARPTILEAAQRYWGFENLRPLQAEAIQAELDHRDSVVVLPTGGGKSLCYQIPPLVAGRVDVVASPLIALMKDQVDGLRACGYPAAALHSNMPYAERSQTLRDILDGHYRLVFTSPERLLTPDFLEVIERLDVRAFAIDEAHCISQWGHDFRPEYRQMSTLKQRFPRASVHAYTATATERVRRDIAEQLQLDEPQFLVGTFDRPNLTYRVIPRVNVRQQLVDVVRRHTGEAAIVYCLSRKESERMAAFLQGEGVSADFYHAGMTADERRATQEAFASEEVDVIAATVAFGMGIDRSNVRCIVHATIPKSIEHYQQETGRAGRDGLEAECVLFYSAADVLRWKSLIAQSAENASDPESVVAAAESLLEEMRRLCTRMQCRHRLLSEYFGQTYDKPNCAACDVCLGDVEGVEDATVNAQKILSCVARVEQRFGIGHVVDVLTGGVSAMIHKWNHDQLSTYGLLRDVPKKSVTSWVYQLIDQGLLDRTAGDRPVVVLNDASWEVLKGTRQVMFYRPKEKTRKSRAAEFSWDGVDRDLFEHLRGVRRELARARSVPAYVIFSDATLRDMAATRPASLDAMRQVHGVGATKLKRYGQQFVDEIAAFGGGRPGALENDAGTAANPPELTYHPVPEAPVPDDAPILDYDPGFDVDPVVDYDFED